MRTEAESHAEDDRRRMEEVEARNRLDGMVYQSEKMIRENKDKIDEADCEDGRRRDRRREEGDERRRHGATAVRDREHRTLAAQDRRDAVQDWSGGGSSASRRGWSRSWGAGPVRAQAAAAAGGGQDGKKQGDVIDAEYVDVDENKRPN